MSVRTLFVTLTVGSFISNIALAAEQKILFNYDHVKFKGYTVCDIYCGQKYTDPPVSNMIKEGWKIVSSSPKEAIGKDTRIIGDETFSCSCVGTQYVLQKDDTPVPFADPKKESANKEVELLKKEIELLKQENNLIKQENENLKEQMKSKHKKK